MPPKPAPAPAAAAPVEPTVDQAAETMAMQESDLETIDPSKTREEIFNAPTMAMDVEAISEQAGEEPPTGARPKTIMIKRPTSPSAKTVKTLKPPSSAASEARTVKTVRPSLPSEDVEDGVTAQKKTSTTKIDLPEEAKELTATASHKRTVKIRRPTDAGKAAPKTVGVKRAGEMAGVDISKSGTQVVTQELQPTGTEGTVGAGWAV
ncbi:MAG: hypothetical protein KDB61_16280, partial [Planctomycetes bacterium]|nr:hypothetical protein [Planctomycetota bacterium]